MKDVSSFPEVSHLAIPTTTAFCFGRDESPATRLPPRDSSSNSPVIGSLIASVPKLTLRFPLRPTGLVVFLSEVSNPRPNIGIVSPIVLATEAVLDEHAQLRQKTTLGRYASYSSAVRTQTRARRMPIAA